jgi:hypothetical protein
VSHNVLISNVKITSIVALQRAINELVAEGHKISLNQSGTFRTYAGQPNKADYTIELQGERHDVGLVKQPDGSYLPVYDPYGMSTRGEGLSCSLDRGQRDERQCIAKLLQRYSTCVAEDELALAGHAVVREKGKDDEIMLTAEYA